MLGKIIDAALIGTVAWLLLSSYATYRNIKIMENQIETIINETGLNEIMAD